MCVLRYCGIEIGISPLQNEEQFLKVFRIFGSGYQTVFGVERERERERKTKYRCCCFLCCGISLHGQGFVFAHF
jgi:hypothetical protein